MMKMDGMNAFVSAIDRFPHSDERRHIPRACIWTGTIGREGVK